MLGEIYSHKLDFSTIWQPSLLKLRLASIGEKKKEKNKDGIQLSHKGTMDRLHYRLHYRLLTAIFPPSSCLGLRFVKLRPVSYPSVPPARRSIQHKHVAGWWDERTTRIGHSTGGE